MTYLFEGIKQIYEIYYKYEFLLNILQINKSYKNLISEKYFQNNRTYFENKTFISTNYI